MPKQEKTVIRKLQRLVERVDLASRDQRPRRADGFESIKSIVKAQWQKKRALGSEGDSYTIIPIRLKEGKLPPPLPAGQVVTKVKFHSSGKAMMDTGRASQQSQASQQRSVRIKSNSTKNPRKPARKPRSKKSSASQTP